ncbi:hypothetical protein K1Y24_02040 [Mammaliicoccus sciuri]|uniref:hypothetical protein n=1 Tax=Mammaliicoccus sciuri TaxID=1296 RepID=UPI001E3142F9|nr:hypothetical protein [Mammaliicoccus sciuri]MCD8800735.1 hypothetical protein [Mammaliicoccus sciuri]
MYQDLMKNHGYKYEDVENLDVDGFLKVWNVNSKQSRTKKVKAGEVSPQELMGALSL